MRRIIFATTALTSMLAFGAWAQEAADPSAPAIGTGEEVQPIDPAAPAPEGEAADGMMQTDPATDTAEEAMPEATPGMETAQDPASPGAAPLDPAGTGMGPVLSPVESADISADRLIGSSIQTMDGENVAEVEDVLVGADGAVENVVAQFGGFLGFGSNKVLLTMDEIEVMQDEAGTLVVQTALTPESLEGRPEYEETN